MKIWGFFITFLGKDYGLNQQQNYDRQFRTDKTTFELH